MYIWDSDNIFCANANNHPILKFLFIHKFILEWKHFKFYALIINFDHGANQYKRFISLWSQWNPLSLGKDNTWIKSMQFWDCSPLYIFSTLLTPFFIIFNSKVSVSKRLSNLDSGYFTHMMQWSRTLSIIVYLASILLSFSYKDKCEWATLASY